MVEVYNEAVFDLLVAPDDGHEKLQIIKKGKETVVQVLFLKQYSDSSYCFSGFDRI